MAMHVVSDSSAGFSMRFRPDGYLVDRRSIAVDGEAVVDKVKGEIRLTFLGHLRPILGQLAPLSAGLTDHGLLAGLADNDHTQYQLRTEKGIANGYGSLDSSVQQPLTQLKTMVGASAGSAGARGSVSQPVAGQQGFVLLGNAVWTDPLSVFTGTQTFVAAAQDTVTTSSLTYVNVPDMSITPGAGIYIALFSASASMNKNSETVQCAIFANGVINPNTVRQLGGQANNIGNFKSTGAVTIAAGQTIDVRWLISSNAGGGQGTMIQRSLILLKTSI